MGWRRALNREEGETFDPAWCSIVPLGAEAEADCNTVDWWDHWSELKRAEETASIRCNENTSSEKFQRQF